MTDFVKARLHSRKGTLDEPQVDGFHLEIDS